MDYSQPETAASRTFQKVAREVVHKTRCGFVTAGNLTPAKLGDMRLFLEISNRVVREIEPKAQQHADNLRRLPLRHKSQESCLIRISQDARSNETGGQGENLVDTFRHRLRVTLAARAEDAADLPSENVLVVPPSHAHLRRPACWPGRQLAQRAPASSRTHRVGTLNAGQDVVNRLNRSPSRLCGPIVGCVLVTHRTPPRQSEDNRID